MNQAGCKLCCVKQLPKVIPLKMHYIPTKDISQALSKFSKDLTVIDVGAGCGCAFGEVLANIDYKSLNHVISFEPPSERTNMFSCNSEYVKPLSLDAKGVKELTDDHELKRIGLFINWPFCAEDSTGDLDVIKLFQPQEVLLVVAFKVEDLQMESVSGSIPLWNEVICPLTILKVNGVKIEKHYYILNQCKEYTEKGEGDDILHLRLLTLVRVN